LPQSSRSLGLPPSQSHLGVRHGSHQQLPLLPGLACETSQIGGRPCPRSGLLLSLGLGDQRHADTSPTTRPQNQSGPGGRWRSTPLHFLNNSPKSGSTFRIQIPLLMTLGANQVKTTGECNTENKHGGVNHP